MNYNIKIDEIVYDEKIIIQKKNYYCSNCNRKGHTFKTCNEPIISNGIIAIYIKNFNSNLIPYLENYIVKNLKIFNNSYNKKTSSPYYKKQFSESNKFDHNSNNLIKSNYKSDSNSSLNKWFEECEKKSLDPTNIDNIANINDNIQFLMVQRKHSLGYLEFMRGRYTLENQDSVIYLLEQMTPDEIKNINSNDFDILWNSLWDLNNIRNKNHHKEYAQSKQKFYQIKLNFPNIIADTKPLYNFN